MQGSMKQVLVVVLAFFFVAALRADVLPGTPFEDEKMESYINWLRVRGAEFPKLKIEYKENLGYRFVANEEIETGETIFKIPEAMILGLKAAYESKIGFVFREQEEIFRETTGSVLAIHLMYEMWGNPDSLWKPFLDTLPETLETPFYWSLEDQKLLKGTYIEARIRMDFQGLIGEYHATIGTLARLYRDLFEPETYSFKRFVWAWSISWTRGFSLPSETGEDTVNFVPGAGFFNHQNEAKTMFMINNNADFVVETHQSWSIGEEVFLNYSPRANWELLRVYGFVLPENKLNNVPLNIFIDQDDPHRSWKEFQLLHAQLLTNPYPFNARVVYVTEETILPALSYLRIKYLEPTEDDINSQTLISPIYKISDENELAALKGLKRSILDAMSKYETTIKTDEEILENEKESLTLTQKIAIQIRLEDKKILKSALRLTEKALKTLKTEL